MCFHSRETYQHRKLWAEYPPFIPEWACCVGFSDAWVSSVTTILYSNASLGESEVEGNMKIKHKRFFHVYSSHWTGKQLFTQCAFCILTKAWGVTGVGRFRYASSLFLLFLLRSIQIIWLSLVFDAESIFSACFFIIEFNKEKLILTVKWQSMSKAWATWAKSTALAN